MHKHYGKSRRSSGLRSVLRGLLFRHLLLFSLFLGLPSPSYADLPFCIDESGEQGRVLERMGCVPAAIAEQIIVLPHELVDEIKVFRKTRSVVLQYQSGASLDFSQLLKLPLLRRLLLSGDPPETLEGLEAVKSLRAVSVDIDGTDLQPLADLQELTQVVLHGRRSFSLLAFAGHPNLRKVVAGADGDSSIMFDLKQMPELETVYARADTTDFSGLSELPKLHRIQVTAKRITGLEALSEARNLSELHLHGGDITDLSFLRGTKRLGVLRMVRLAARNLRPLESAINLRRLTLEGDNIDFATLPELPHLVSLYLSGGTATDLSVLRQFTKLNDLDLRNMVVGDLADLPHIARLWELNLEGSNVENLASLARYTTLRRLTLPDGTKFENRRQVEAFLRAEVAE